MVSVIIPDREDRTYLIRCLNSIRRQTFHDTEIILLGDDYPENLLSEYHAVCAADLASALRIMGGERFMLCSMTSVLSRNVIEELLKEPEERGRFRTALCTVPSSADYVPADSIKAAFSLYGKLYPRKGINERIQILSADAMETSLLVSALLGGGDGFESAEDGYLYESDPSVFDFVLPDTLSEAEIECWKTGAAFLTEEERDGLLFSWVENASDEKRLSRMISVAMLYPEDTELNYSLASTYLKPAYQQAITARDPVLYKDIQTYFDLFSGNDEYMTVLCSLCSMCEEQFDLMRQHDVAHYAFYYDKIPCRQTILREYGEISHLRDEMKSYLTQIQEREKTITEWMQDYSPSFVFSSPGGRDAGVYSDMRLSQLHGPILANYMIEQYRQGALGLKPLLKSLFAWLAFKIKKH